MDLIKKARLDGKSEVINVIYYIYIYDLDHFN